ncbi:DUF4355 domain-containing protein [Veillonella parvula]|uniref:DUF4355 domain-containing protein n=1 Tax=Veillonella parvula TaxID=29466 RepID=UPI0012BA8B9E|nr:DUF4355 domain-containing protein [Veillonella parvula]MTH28279.1 DUF4355 domain-containing protein [Veillonella parvula]
MAEEIKKDEVVEEGTEQASTQEQAETTEKTFTQEELDAIIQKEKGKAKRAAEREYQAKMDEAEKLRKMNAEQKAEYEAKKQADYIAELEAKINRSGLEKEASKMLSEAGIVATDDILAFVVKDDAESTQETINSFTSLVNDLADKKVSEMLKGKTPKKVEQSTAGGVTKEQFARMGYKSRNDLLQSDPELYAKLVNG